MDKHTAIPKPFQNGDLKEWIAKFEVCATSKGWDDPAKTKKIPTLLEGEALVVYLEMEEDDKDYSKVKEALREKFTLKSLAFKP